MQNLREPNTPGNPSQQVQQKRFCETTKMSNFVFIFKLIIFWPLKNQFPFENFLRKKYTYILKTASHILLLAVWQKAHTYALYYLEKKKKEIQLAELTKTDTADPPSCRFHICNLPIR